MKNVLLVDDDLIFNFINTRVLKALPFINMIDTAQNGKQAIDLFNNYFVGSKPLPDFILLDINMPVMDGFGFLEAFRELALPQKQNVKIIILSSSADPTDIQRAKNYGVTQYLTKPLEEHRLLDAISKLSQDN
jgi:YesN/AraC family two-component response regulator